MKYEFWVNVKRANMIATPLAANKQLISVAHVILVNASEWPKKIPVGPSATLLLDPSIKVANIVSLCGTTNSIPT